MRYVAAAFLVLHLILGWSLRAPGASLAIDDANYVLLGQELGHLRYRSVWLAGAPPHGQYPPVYPALLAVSGATRADRSSIGVVLSLLLSTAALGVFTLLCWRWSPAATLGALGIAAVSPLMLKLAGTVNSEPLFTLLLMLTLWCAVARPSRWVLAALAAIAVALTRGIGVAVVAGLLIDWAWSRRFRPAAGLALAAVVTLGLWFARAASVPEQRAGQSYVGDALYQPRPPAPVTVPPALPPGAPAVVPPPAAPGPPPVVEPVAPPAAPSVVMGLLRRMADNAIRYASRALPTVLYVPLLPGTRADNLGWPILLAGLGLVGAMVTWRRRALMPLVVACYVGILLVWPYVITRFLLPVLPLLIFFVLEGAQQLSGRLARSYGSVAVAGLTGVLMVSGLREDGRQIRALGGCDRARPYQSDRCFSRADVAFFATIADADSLAPAGATFLAPKPATVYLLTGHAGVDDVVAASLGPDELDRYLRSNGVNLAVLSRIHPRSVTVGAGLLAHCRDWRLVKNRESAGSVLLQRREFPDTTGSSCEVLGRLNLTSP